MYNRYTALCPGINATRLGLTVLLPEGGAVWPFTFVPHQEPPLQCLHQGVPGPGHCEWHQLAKGMGRVSYTELQHSALFWTGWEIKVASLILETMRVEQLSNAPKHKV